MISANQARKLSDLHIGEQEDRTYTVILHACIKGHRNVAIRNESIAHSELNDLKNMGFNVRFPGNGETVISWE